MAWVEQSQTVMVAVDATGALVGTSYLKPNSLALGVHVANPGYVVAEHCRRQVVGTLPGAFGHLRLGYVDALVMVQALVVVASP